MLVKRKEYLDKLISLKDKKVIKIITGVRRCGKSTLMEIFKDYLRENGVDEKNIAVFIKNLVLSGNKIAERKRLKNGRLTIQQNYEYKGKYYTLNAVGTNGFIVTCYPIESEE